MLQTQPAARWIHLKLNRNDNQWLIPICFPWSLKMFQLFHLFIYQPNAGKMYDSCGRNHQISKLCLFIIAMRPCLENKPSYFLLLLSSPSSSFLCVLSHSSGANSVNVDMSPYQNTFICKCMKYFLGPKSMYWYLHPASRLEFPRDMEVGSISNLSHHVLLPIRYFNLKEHFNSLMIFFLKRMK